MLKKLILKILPEGLEVEVPEGTALSKAFELAGVDFAYPCARAKLCGKCRVVFEEGAPLPSSEESNLLHHGEIEAGVRLACCCKLESSGTVRLPDRESLRKEHVLEAGYKSEVVIDPEVKKFHCVLPASTLEAPMSDWSRVIQALPEEYRKDARPTLDVLRKLPGLVACASESGEAVTLTLFRNRVIHVQCGEHGRRHYGVAVDLGTTTIAGVLVDMHTGEEVTSGGTVNPQRSFGHDLISRIHAVQMDFGNLQIMHDKVIGAVSELIASMSVEQGLTAEDIGAVSVAGNTVMSHLFLKIDPQALGRAPFAGTLRAGVRLEGRDLGLPVHPHAPVYTLPCMGGFVGGDIVAGILMSKIEQLPGVQVLIDIGTNGEVVVSKDGVLYTTSSAAGPAFEGGKIDCGIIAHDGAINRVDLVNGDFVCGVIGDAAPKGVCGSGLIEVLARSLETGVLQMNGRFAEKSMLGPLEPALVNRLHYEGAQGPRLLLSPARDGQAEVYVSQQDVREFQLGKAAVQTAILMVLEEVGVALEEVDRFLIAGAFGNHLNGEDAITLGLLPDIPREKIFFIGNSSLEGARCALVNRYERQRAEQLADEARFIELATRPTFQDRFAMAMMLSPSFTM